MKRFLTFFFTLVSATVSAATLAPIQLLNPAGSTAGQVIASTGPSSAPAWSAVSAGALAPIAANTILGNFTASSAAPAAFAAPSCSTANSALKYTSGTGLSCGTTFALTSGNLSQFAATSSAQLLGVLNDETGSGLAVFNASPSLTTPTIAGASLSGTFSGTPTFSGAVAFSSTLTPSQTAGIVGTTTNNNANAGSVGEAPTGQTLTTSMTTNVAGNCTSVSLTAGDWDIQGVVRFIPAGTTTVSALVASISTTSATLGSFGQYSQIQGTLTTGGQQALATPIVRISISGTTTIYLVGISTFATSTMTCDGNLFARRVR